MRPLPALILAFLSALAGVLSASPAVAQHPLPGPSLLGAEARARAQVAVTALRQQQAPSTLRVAWRPDRERPTMLRGLALRLPGRTLERRARAFVDRYPGLVAEGSRELFLLDQRVAAGRRVLRFEQRLHGIPVDGSLVTMAFDGADQLLAVHAETRPLPKALETRPRITSAQAVEAARREVSRRPARPGEARLLYGLRSRLLVQVLPQQARLVYRVVLPLSIDLAGRQHLIDARSGAYLSWRPGVLWHRRGQRMAGVRR